MQIAKVILTQVCLIMSRILFLINTIHQQPNNHLVDTNVRGLFKKSNGKMHIKPDNLK